MVQWRVSLVITGVEVCFIDATCVIGCLCVININGFVDIPWCFYNDVSVLTVSESFLQKKEKDIKENIRERCWFWSCRRKGQMKMCLSCYMLCRCMQWLILFIWCAFYLHKPWNSLFQLLLLTCSIFMYSDHDIVASFLVNKSASLLEDNILKLQDDIFDEMNVPNTKVFTWLITLILFNPYFLNFDSNSFVESGCYPVSRAFHWIKHYKGRVWGWSSWK